MMILADVSSGRSDFDRSSPTKLEISGSGAPAISSMGAACVPVPVGLERRGPHRDYLDFVAGAHGLHSIAGVNEPLERIRRNDLYDIGDLHHVEQSGNSRHDILAGGCRRRDDRLVGWRERDHQRSQRLRQHVLVGRLIRQQHLFHTVEIGGGFPQPAGRTARRPARARRRRAPSPRSMPCGLRPLRLCCRARRSARWSCEDDLQIKPISFLSLSTSSPTVLTLTPALRPPGSMVFITSRRGEGSTP